MNLVPATSIGDGTAVRLPFGELAGGPWAAALGRFPVGTPVLLGLRPHDLQPAEGMAHGPRFDTRVHLTEPLGDVTVLDLEARRANAADGAARGTGIALPRGRSGRNRGGSRAKPSVHDGHRDGSSLAFS